MMQSDRRDESRTPNEITPDAAVPVSAVPVAAAAPSRSGLFVFFIGFSLDSSLKSLFILE